MANNNGSKGNRGKNGDRGSKGITIKNGKSGRQVASALRQHDQTMHSGKKAPKITVTGNGGNSHTGNGRNGRNGNGKRP